MFHLFIFQLPREYKFIDVFDYFLKAHHVFALKPHPHLIMLVKFLDIYAFEMNNVVATSPTYLKVHVELLKAANSNNNN